MDEGGPARALAGERAAVGLMSDPAAAMALLDPQRRRLLEALAEPGSSASVARGLGMGRQKVNYHLRELERLGLVEFVGERRRGNCTERLVRATAAHYLVDPAALGALGVGGEGEVAPDRFSWAYLVAVAARTIRELAVLSRRARRAGKPLATFTLHTDLRFASAKALGAFTEELSNEVARLAAKHQSAERRDAWGAKVDDGGRLFRFVIGAYPAITKQEADDEASGRDQSPPHPPSRE